MSGSLELAVDTRQPGVYLDLPNEVYQSSAGISNTGLRRLAKSPFHFYSLHLDPDRPEQVTKAGQLEGTLAHCAVLEPLQLTERYVCGPDVSRATNEWKTFAARHQGKTAVKPDQYEVARAQARSVRQIADVAELLDRGHPEVSAYWYEDVVDPITEEITQVLCRCRPDWVHPVNDDSVILVDMKTFSSADAREFSKQVAAKGYANQCAFYTRGYEQASGKKVEGFVFVVTEMEFPHAAAAYQLDPKWVEMAHRENDALLKIYAQCLNTDVWPSYSASVQLIQKPTWLR